MRKVLDFATYKRITKYSLNEFNRWVKTLYDNAFNDGLEFAKDNMYIEQRITPEDLVSAYTDERLMEILLSVKGIGKNRAQEVVDKIMAEGVDESLWE